MANTYLKDLSPEEVINRLKKGEVVFTIDSKGKEFSYKMIKGVIVAYDESKGTVSGYNRSLYVTDNAYFKDEDTLKVLSGHWYKAKNGSVVRIDRAENNPVYCYFGYIQGRTTLLSWTANGTYDLTDPNNDYNLVEDITENV